VGIGEAAYAPVASAMLSDADPARQRGSVLAAFNIAVPVGSALGFGIGGVITTLTGDWRPAFWFTFSGLLLGALCFAKKELPRPAGTTGAGHPSYLTVLKGLARNRSFALCCAGMTAIVFVTGGVAAWVPAYFFQREARFEVTPAALTKLEEKLPADEVDKLRPLAGKGEYTYPQMKAAVAEALGASAKQHSDKVFAAAVTPASPSAGGLSTIFGGILVIGGIAATATGAWLGEKLRRGGVRGAYFWVSAAGAALSIPCFLGILYTDLPLSWACAFLAIFGLFLYTGPGNTILANVVKSDVRGTAFAINVLVIHALGDVISPPLIGAVADATSLQTAFALTAAVIALGAVLWFWGVRYLDEDTARAEGPATSSGTAT
jgi:MFS family permease